MKNKIISPVLVTLFLASILSMAFMTPAAANTTPSLDWLPPMTNQDVIQLKDGSTLPIKFTFDPFVIPEKLSVFVSKVLLMDDFEGYSLGSDG